MPVLLCGLVAVACTPTGAGPTPTSTREASATPTASVVPSTAVAPPDAAPTLPASQGGMIARAPSNDALYIADEDHGVVRRIPLPLDPQAKGTPIAMPGLPAQVLPIGDRVLVTIRSEGGTAPGTPDGKPEGKPDPKVSRIPVSPTGAGLLMIMKRDASAGLVEVARVQLPADAWGIAVTPDGKTALVTSAWTHQVSAVDLATAKKTWTLDVPREPRAIVVRADGASAYVTHLVGGMITRIDDLTGQAKAHAVSLPPAPLRAPSGKTLDGTLAYSAALSPDGKRFFVARHALGAMAEQAWYGAPTVDVLLTGDDTPLAPVREPNAPRVTADLAKMMAAGFNVELAAGVPRAAPPPIAEPRAMLYRKKSSTLLVAGEGTNQVVELDARAVDPTMFVVGKLDMGFEPARPKGQMLDAVTARRQATADRAKAVESRAVSGLALSADESTVWVYCRATNEVVAAALPFDGKAYTRLHVADEWLDDLEGRGRRAFYDAIDTTISGGVSCAGCHPEGRDDGHVWHEAKFQTKHSEHAAVNFLADGDLAPIEKTKSVGYARQTPMIVGRVGAKGPYGWHGESPELTDRIEAGFGLHRWGELREEPNELLGRAQRLVAFLRHGLVPPPRDVHPPTTEEEAGKTIFNSDRARCAKCHVPATEYTDRASYPFSPKFPTVASFEDEKEDSFKTPSLLFVAGTPPYFHDGHASTLETLIEQNGDRMGHTSHLSAEEKKALVAFLKTL